MINFGKTIYPALQKTADAINADNVGPKCMVNYAVKKCFSLDRDFHVRQGFECLKKYGCDFKYDPKYYKNAREMEMSYDRLANQAIKPTAQDFARVIIPAVMRYQKEMNSVLRDYFTLLKKYAKGDYKCDSKCVDTCTNTDLWNYIQADLCVTTSCGCDLFP